VKCRPLRHIILSSSNPSAKRVLILRKENSLVHPHSKPPRSATRKNKISFKVKYIFIFTERKNEDVLRKHSKKGSKC
jgi:hypothetical protein